MDKLILIEQELSFLGLLDKAREIYSELGPGSALSYIKSSYHLLSKIYHPDLNPGNEEKAVLLQQRLNSINKLISQTSDREIIGILRKSSPEEPNPKKKILLVEDEPYLRKIFHNLFLMEGYEVRVAIDGEDGYHNFLAFNPDLVFTDIVMPKMSGMELVRNIRRHKPHIKVIYISGFFGLRNIKRDLNKELLKHNYPFLSKPFRISTMLDLVHKYLADPVKVDVQA